MGQYYKPYIKFEDGTEESYCSQNAIYMTKHGITSKEELEKADKSWSFDDPDSYSSCFSGLKLMEHSWMENDFVNGIIERIWDNPASIAWVGDYADSCLGEVVGFTEKIYRKVWSDGDECLPELPFPALPDIHRTGCLVNHSQLVFLDLERFYTENVVDAHGGKWCVHPLPLLTAMGNGMGGGDYFSPIGINDVGTWALDKIEYTYEKPDRPYCEVMYRFDSNA